MLVCSSISIFDYYLKQFNSLILEQIKENSCYCEPEEITPDDVSRGHLGLDF